MSAEIATTEAAVGEVDVEAAVFCVNGGMHSACPAGATDFERDSFVGWADTSHPSGAPHHLSERTVTFGPWVRHDCS